MLDATDANAGLQSEPWPPVPLDAEFFERCEQHLGAKLDHDTRKELQRAVWQAWLDLAQHSPLTAENADRLYNIANLTTQLSFEIKKLEKDAPGLQDCVFHFAHNPDLLPLSLPRGLGHDERLAQLKSMLLDYFIGTLNEATKIRSIVPPGKDGAKQKIYTHSLIKAVVKIAQSVGCEPQGKRGEKGSFSRFAKEVYNAFAKEERLAISANEDAFSKTVARVIAAQN